MNRAMILALVLSWGCAARTSGNYATHHVLLTEATTDILSRTLAESPAFEPGDCARIVELQNGEDPALRAVVADAVTHALLSRGVPVVERSDKVVDALAEESGPVETPTVAAANKLVEYRIIDVSVRESPVPGRAVERYANVVVRLRVVDVASGVAVWAGMSKDAVVDMVPRAMARTLREAAPETPASTDTPEAPRDTDGAPWLVVRNVQPPSGSDGDVAVRSSPEAGE